MIKKQYPTTKKLHYGKYLYKIKIALELSFIFRSEHQKGKSLRFARSKLDEWQAQLIAGIRPKRTKYNWDSYITKEDLYRSTKVYNILVKETNYLIRCEIKTLFVYTNSEELVDKLDKNIDTVLEIHKPDPMSIHLLKTKENIILVSSTPEYQYKVVLGKKPGAPALPTWIRNNPNLAKMGEIAMQECTNRNWVKGYYFYVRDEKSLFIADLIVGDNIQSVYKLVYNDLIDK